mgnify:CR=1 FL=1
MAQGVRGTRDFYPEDMRIRNWLFDKFHNASKSHGFEEYDTPIVEYEELYTRKAGEDITQQLYNFEDKGGRKLSLRPEMTPSLARMIMAKAGTLPIPIKWYSIPQCWRYERSQRGRGREHYQWNVDIWGVNGVEAEAELFSILIHFFSDVGLTSNDLRIRISNRKILEELLNSLSITGSQFTQTCIVMDKMDKIPMEAITEQLSEIGINDEAISQILDCLNIKKLSNLATILGEDSTALSELNNLRVRYGDTLVVIGAFFWAFHIVFISKFLKIFNFPITIASFQCLTAALISLIPAFSFEYISFRMLSLEAAELLYAGVLSSGIAFMLQIFGQQNLSPAPVAIIFSLEGVFGSIAAWIMLDQFLNEFKILGIIIILSAVIFSQIAPMYDKRKYGRN